MGERAQQLRVDLLSVSSSTCARPRTSHSRDQHNTRNCTLSTTPYAINFFKNRLWNSVLSKSLTNSFLGVSLVPRAWFLKITSSSHRLLIPNDEDEPVEDIMEGEGEAPKLRADWRFRRGLRVRCG